MKKMTILMATAMLAACSSETEPLNDGARLSLSCRQLQVEGSETRAGATEHTALNGEDVSVYMPSSTVTTAMTYTVASTTLGDGRSTMTSESTPYLYYSRTPVYGVYPTATAISGDLLSHTVQLDQSGSANYALSDLMYASTSAARSDASAAGVIAIDMVFHHLMAKVTVNVEVDNSYPYKVTGVWFINIGKTLQLKPSTYAISHDALTGLTATNNVGGTYTNGIKAGTTSGCTALIPPQTVSNMGFIVLGVQGTGSKASHSGTATFAVSSSQSFTFLPGRSYSITLTLGPLDYGNPHAVSLKNWSETIALDNPRLS